MVQGARDFRFLRSAVWKLGHWRVTVGWSIPAEVSKILGFLHCGARRPHKHGIGLKPECDSNAHRPSGTVISLFPAVHAAQYAPSGAEHKVRSSPREQRLKDASWSCVLWNDRGFHG